jgi:hypothetical protein
MEASNIAPGGSDQVFSCPDGLTSAHIEQMLAEAEAHWATAARPTAAFLDGSAELRRRERRVTRRAFGAVVRTLPARPARDYVAPADEVA